MSRFISTAMLAFRTRLKKKVLRMFLSDGYSHHKTE